MIIWIFRVYQHEWISIKVLPEGIIFVWISFQCTRKKHLKDIQYVILEIQATLFWSVFRIEKVWETLIYNTPQQALSKDSGAFDYPSLENVLF